MPHNYDWTNINLYCVHMGKLAKTMGKWSDAIPANSRNQDMVCSDVSMMWYKTSFPNRHSAATLAVPPAECHSSPLSQGEWSLTIWWIPVCGKKIAARDNATLLSHNFITYFVEHAYHLYYTQISVILKEMIVLCFLILYLIWWIVCKMSIFLILKHF